MRKRIKPWQVCLPLAVLTTVVLALNLIPALCLRTPMPAVGHKTFDVIITLGYPARADGQPSVMLKQRVVAAVKLFQAQRAQHMLFTGGAAHNRYVEATVMAALAHSLGVPSEKIIQETQARNTCQNAAHSVALMQQRHWHSAIIVTSPNHLKRASYLFAHYPIDFAVSSSGYPVEMPRWERVLFDQWEQYALTRLTFSGYPSCP